MWISCKINLTFHVFAAPKKIYFHHTLVDRRFLVSCQCQVHNKFKSHNPKCLNFIQVNKYLFPFSSSYLTTFPFSSLHYCAFKIPDFLWKIKDQIQSFFSDLENKGIIQNRSVCFLKIFNKEKSRWKLSSLKNLNIFLREISVSVVSDFHKTISIGSGKKASETGVSRLA